MIRYAHFYDDVMTVIIKGKMLTNCNNNEGSERKTCQEHNCCMGEKKDCPNSCQCPNNKNREGGNDGA